MADYTQKQYLDQAGLATLVAQIKAEDAKIVKKVDDEITRSKAADQQHDADIATVAADLVEEVARAKAAEQANTDAIATEKTRAEGEEAKLQAAIDAINGADNGILAQATVLVNAEKDRAMAKENELANAITAEENRAKAAEQKLAEDIDAHEAAIDNKVATLIGEDTDKSVRTIAYEELAKQLLSGDADADFKSLQQLAAWLEDHPEDVVEMNKNISDNAKAIADEVKRAGEAETALDGRVDALEEAIGAGGSVETQITAKIDELDANVDSTGSSLIAINVKEENGKLTTVTVSENLANTFDAKGAAEAAQTAAATDATNKANAAQAAAEATAAADATAKANQALTDAKAYTDSAYNAIVEIPSADIEALFK